MPRKYIPTWIMRKPELFLTRSPEDITGIKSSFTERQTLIEKSREPGSQQRAPHSGLRPFNRCEILYLAIVRCSMAAVSKAAVRYSLDPMRVFSISEYWCRTTFRRKPCNIFFFYLFFFFYLIQIKMFNTRTYKTKTKKTYIFKHQNKSYMPL